MRGCATRSPKGEAWWSQTGSNRRPHACKARALPTELWPPLARGECVSLFGKTRHVARRAVALAAFGGNALASGRRPARPTGRRGSCRVSQGGERRRRRLRPAKMVGLGRLELPTSRLSSARSNQLSYKPGARDDRPETGHVQTLGQPGFSKRQVLSKRNGSSGKKEKRGRQSPAKSP